MKLLSFLISYLNIFYFKLCYVECRNYTEAEINKAWTKMMKKSSVWKTFDGQMGCWPGNIIPYTIVPGFNEEQIQHIMRDIYQIQNRTCVRWVDRNSIKSARKFVEFKYSKESGLCSTGEWTNPDDPSGVMTSINLGDFCFEYKSVLHEMLHAMGFIHEQSRIDRDCYVDINDDYVTNLNFQIFYDDLDFEKWPYDKRSTMHYKRLPEDSDLFSTEYIIKDKDEPFGGLLWKYRLGTATGFWGYSLQRTGKLTKLDAYKINYRFCGAPDFCETQPKVCQDIEEEEKMTGCKELYMELAGKEVNQTK